MWLQYALDKDDNLVSVHDVKRGRSDVRCPYCQGELTAKKGKVKKHHFAHVKDTCNQSKNENIRLPLIDGFELLVTGDELRILKHLNPLGLEVYRRDPYYSEYRTIRRYYDLPSTIYKIVSNLVDKKLVDYDECQPTDLGKAILKELTLSEFNSLQEQLSRTKLEKLQQEIIKLQSSVENTDKFKQTDYYKYKPIRYQRVVEKNQRLEREQMQQTFTDFQLYCAQYSKVIQHNLYLLKITTSGQLFHKIGITSQGISDRIQEVRRDLLKLFSSVSVSLIGLWQHYGNVEYYFKYRYSEFSYSIGNLTEYFLFSDIKPILNDLNTLQPKQLSLSEQKILDNSFIHSFKTTLGMLKAKQNGTHIGRRSGEAESLKKFLAKPKNKAIATVLKKGLSLRQTASEAGVTVNTVRKVKAALEQIQNRH